MKQTMRLNVSQRLSMTPALQQAIRMLQLSTIDLKTEIRDTLESNFMLEVEEPDTVKTDKTNRADSAQDSSNAATDNNIPDNLPLDTQWSDIYTNDSTASASQQSSSSQDWRDYQQDSLTEAPDLRAHLAWQADMHPFTPPQRQVASHIIDAVDDNGFVNDWLEIDDRLTKTLDLTAGDTEEVLDVIQGFDPPGVGARNLAECLAIQLRQLDRTTDGYHVALTLVENDHLDELVHGRLETLARKLDVHPRQIERARVLLRTLQPHPGNDYIQSRADYIIPEVFVVRQQSHWLVLLNPDIAPHLRINSQYLGLMNNAQSTKDRSALKSHLQEARSFLHSLKSRNETLLQVAQCIVEAQRGFLDYGEEAMKPLVLRDVSNLLDIHESTVSRATANKFIQTPRGIFELKYFFSSHVSTADGGNASATAIQAMIKRLIANEVPTKPISDNKLATMLRDDDGINVARRTVAKYREEMDIAPSHQRKRKPI